MADYSCTFRTNYFRVTDEAKYQELYQMLHDPTLSDVSKEYTPIQHMFGGYSSPTVTIPPSKNTTTPELTDAIIAKEVYNEDENRIPINQIDSYVEDGDVLYDKNGNVIYSWDTIDIYDWVLELQKILPEDEVFVYIESGHENLRYVTSYVIIATHNKIKQIALNEIIDQTVKELLNDPNATTVYEY